MLIAFVTTITVLPAALTILRPPAEPHQMGFAKLAPLDRFMMRHRIAIVVLTIAAVLCASPLLLRVKFDFNPMHLQNPNAESVATFLERRTTPIWVKRHQHNGPLTCRGERRRARLAALPQVSRAMTLESFIPDAQDQKLAAIQHAAAALDTTIKPANIRPAPSDAETVQALESAATGLSQVAGEDKEAEQLRRDGSLLFSPDWRRRRLRFASRRTRSSWHRSNSSSTSCASCSSRKRSHARPAIGFDPELDRGERRCARPSPAERRFES